MTPNNLIPVSVLMMQTEAIKASMDNRADTRELALAKTKLEESIMWLTQHLRLNPEVAETQGELSLFNEQKAEEAPVKKKANKTKPEVEVVQQPATMQKAEEVQPKAVEVKLPSKEEMIQLAKDFGKANGVEAFLNLLKSFDCKNVSEVYGLGTEAVEKLYNTIK
jgi:hypothetical protein